MGVSFFWSFETCFCFLNVFFFLKKMLFLNFLSKVEKKFGLDVWLFFENYFGGLLLGRFFLFLVAWIFKYLLFG